MSVIENITNGLGVGPKRKHEILLSATLYLSATRNQHFLSIVGNISHGLIENRHLLVKHTSLSLTSAACISWPTCPSSSTSCISSLKWCCSEPQIGLSGLFPLPSFPVRYRDNAPILFPSSSFSWSSWASHPYPHHPLHLTQNRIKKK